MKNEKMVDLGTIYHTIYVNRLEPIIFSRDEPDRALEMPDPIKPSASPSTISISTCCPDPFPEDRKFSLCNISLNTNAKPATTSMKIEQNAMPLTYQGPSLAGYNLVPTSGPHWPMMFRTIMPVPLPSLAGWLSSVHVMMIVIAEKKPAAAG